MNETHNVLPRMRELAVQAANDTLTDIVTGPGSGAATFQVGPNAGQTVPLALGSTLTTAVHGPPTGAFRQSGAFSTLGSAASRFSGLPTSVTAQLMILSRDDAIADVSEFHSSLGALQNRLEHATENLTTTAENMTASESRIRNADMSTEMAQFTRNSIMPQAGTSMLAQANQLPHGALTLVR